MHHINSNESTELEEDTSWGYLDSVEVGRLATAHDGQPSVLPVNFVVDGTSIVFRTAEGTKLAEVVLNQHVAFEADHVTAASRRRPFTAGTRVGSSARAPRRGR